MGGGCDNIWLPSKDESGGDDNREKEWRCLLKPVSRRKEGEGRVLKNK